MFLIDFETKGNLIKLYFGNDKDYWGDDWNDRPYEHNAELVYSNYIEKEASFVFPFNYDVLLAEDDWSYQGNSPYAKEDFKDNKAPCMIIVKDDDSFDARYSKYLGAKSDNVLSIYYNSDICDLTNQIINFGGISLDIDI